jgi:hypothetical protein
VDGYFKCPLRKELNNPPTTFGGIQELAVSLCRKIFE